MIAFWSTLTRRNPLAYSTTARPTLPFPEHRYDALIYTDSTQNLSEALNRGIDKETALGAIQDDERERKEDREKVIKEPPAPQQQQLPFDHSLDQRPTYPEPAQTQAATLPTEIPIEISRARYEPAISTESAQNLQETLDRV